MATLGWAAGCSFSVDYNNTTFLCNAATECPSGFQCNGGRCTTGAAPGCKTDADCAANQTCTNGSCAAASGCTQDNECGVGGYCLERKCYQGAPGSPCSNTIQCQTGHVCADTADGKICAKQCVEHTDCSGTQTCKPSLTGGDSVCVNSCNAVEQKGCKANQVCVLQKGRGFCQTKRNTKIEGLTCTQDADCELHLYCRPVKGYPSIRRCTGVCNTDNGFGCKDPGQSCIALPDQQGFGFCEPQPTVVNENEICGGDLICGSGARCVPEPGQSYGRCRSAP